MVCLQVQSKRRKGKNEGKLQRMDEFPQPECRPKFPAGEKVSFVSFKKVFIKCLLLN